MDRFAHSVPGKPEAAWEPLSAHLEAVGRRAAEFAEPFGASAVAQAMGMLHDIGKYSLTYQSYIRQSHDDNVGRRGPDHSTAGAQEALKAYDKITGRVMAFGIAGHHGGLMDGQKLEERLRKPLDEYAGWRACVADLPTVDILNQTVPKRTQNAIGKGFSAAFMIRMLFSCLVDADFLETERFYAASRNDRPPERGGVIGEKHRAAVRAHMARHRGDDTEVNRLRSAILDHANGKALLPPGLFTLTVPTGGGKTLTSLSFGMEHALAHDLRRLVYVIPFTSVIEQTAAVFRDDVGLGNAVLEHHSSFDWDRREPETGNDSEEEGISGIAKLRRDAENWDAPIVVTTAVQFFESLFAARTSKARKLHNLARSVIVIDEAQSIPVHLLRPCLAVIDELARNYGATVVLCTATQPALREQDGALLQTDEMKRHGERAGLHIPAERELAPDPPALYQKLKRVEVEWRREPVNDAEIAARFAEQPQMLCIVNSRAHARELYAAIDRQAGAVHLTTLMCAKHRRAVLAKVREDLKAKRPVRLVATSLIEAGVDVSFPEVWRAATGLASIAQAAGRCNRSGELGDLGAAFGRAIVFEPAGRDLPPAIEAFYGPARDVLRSVRDDVLGLKTIHDYYRALYWRAGPAALDRPTPLDAAPIIRSIRENRGALNFPFAAIADAFRLIDDRMEPVIVPWDDDARSAIAALRCAEFPPAGVQRKLQQYVVPVRRNVREAMLLVGAIQRIRPEEFGDRFVVLESSSLYDPDLGLGLNDPTWRASESNIIS